MAADLQYTLGLDGRQFSGGIAGSIAMVGNLGLAMEAVAKIGRGLSLGVRLAADFETTSTAINTTLKDINLTKAVLEDLNNFAATTPFEMPGIANTARQLLGAGTGVGELKGELQVLGDLAAGAGGDMLQLALVLNQVRGAGKLMTQDFMQLTNAGVVGLREELAKVKGIGIEQVADAMSAGQISADDLWKTLKGMTTEGGKFYNAMVAQSMTWNGLMSTISDNASGLMRTLGQPVMEALKPTLQEVIAGLGQATRFASVFSETLKMAAVDGKVGEFLGVAVSYGLKKAGVTFIELMIEGFSGLSDAAYDAIYNGLASAWNATLGQITGRTFDVGDSFAKGFLEQMFKGLEETEAKFDEFMRAGRLKIEADKNQAKQALEEAGKQGGQAFAREAAKGATDAASPNGKGGSTEGGRRKIMGYSRERQGDAAAARGRAADRGADSRDRVGSGLENAPEFAGQERPVAPGLGNRRRGTYGDDGTDAGMTRPESLRDSFNKSGAFAGLDNAFGPRGGDAAGRVAAATNPAAAAKAAAKTDTTGTKLDEVVSELRRIRTE
jgi:tape measure domain-containing protein